MVSIQRLGLHSTTHNTPLFLIYLAIIEYLSLHTLSYTQYFSFPFLALLTHLTFLYLPIHLSLHISSLSLSFPTTMLSRSPAPARRSPPQTPIKETNIPLAVWLLLCHGGRCCSRVVSTPDVHTASYFLCYHFYNYISYCYCVIIVSMKFIDLMLNVIVVIRR